MLFRRSPSPLDAATPRADVGFLRLAWVGASSVLLLASCFDSKRIIFEGPDAAAADVAVGGLAPAANAGMLAPSGEAGPSNALAAAAATPGGAVTDAGTAVEQDVVVDEERRRAACITANPATATEHLQLHDLSGSSPRGRGALAAELELHPNA